MIKHIVLFSFKDSFTAIEIEKLYLSLGHLKTFIPQIKSYSYGKNNSNENLSHNFDYGFVMEFESEIERDFYLKHAEHLKIVNEIIHPNLKNGLDSVLVLDFKY